MAAPNEAQATRLGIVGGGRGGNGLLAFFGGSQQVKVAFVVDPNLEAPAMQAARQAGIPVFPELVQAIREHPVDFVFEVTGNEAAAARTASELEGSGATLVPDGVARMLVTVLSQRQSEVAGEVTGAVTSIKSEIVASLDGSRALVSRINQIMSSMQMLALNASIEAAKVGVHGKGFAVVADHMTKSVESVRKLTQEIEAVNGKIQSVSQDIDGVLEKLR